MHPYKPLQPSLLQETEAIYHEFPASSLLGGIIRCYWSLQTAPLVASGSQTAKPLLYRVATDACVDVIVDIARPEAPSVIVGATNAPILFPLDYGAEFFGVRFLPSMIQRIFAVHLGEIAHQTLPFEDVIAPNLRGEARIWVDCLHKADSFEERNALTDSFLLHALALRNFTHDTRLLQALDALYASHGAVKIEEEVRKHHAISLQQLRRIFQASVGLSPKTFARIVRFQAMLKALTQHSRQPFAGNHEGMFFDVGFYDQAHLIHEFQSLYGVSPSAFMRLQGMYSNTDHAKK
jgi:AraC-like DNA-binding protein